MSFYVVRGWEWRYQDSMSRVETLMLLGEFRGTVVTHYADIIAQISSMAVQTLYLRYEWGGSMVDYMASTDHDQCFTALKCLTVCGSPETVRECPLKNYQQKTSKLKFIDFQIHCSGSAIHTLLKWPEALKEVRISVVTASAESILQEALYAQSDSLERIFISAHLSWYRCHSLLTFLRSLQCASIIAISSNSPHKSQQNIYLTLEIEHG